MKNKSLTNLKWFYLLTFFGVGSISPLLSVYFSEVQNLNGYQVGTLLSIGPIMMIFFQPIWGILADLKNAHHKLLMITTLIAGIAGLGYLAFGGYYWFLFVAIILGVFQSAIIPLSDSISIQYANRVKVNYGNIRLFGSLGFGLAVFVMGWLSEFSPDVIFYAFFIVLTIAAFLSLSLPREKPLETKVNLFSGVKDLLAIRRFVVFLLITFLIFGPNLANNFYFSLFIEYSGGTYTGIGIAFLLAVLSEIPFMRVAGAWIHKLGLLQVALIAGVASLVRWLFYFLEPGIGLIYATTIIQGFSLGLFIPAGIQYVREVSPITMTATAVTLYSAIGNGFGNWFCTFISGMIFEEFSIFAVYLFFGAMSFIGVILTGWLIRLEKKQPIVMNAIS
ncbi:MFS transporter, PPP family, 3-phenylpropionic acid transporter [Mesobacillus persicus]|uniref:MFS transporter, PPP family, 3-phenylpropionic acid transporter n=1 Tax=Mesobacillus persicus TaxID=930146 RepID=A0A1H8HMM5_9BACI|nr:MFS transporter [Mesobacillus persicus]SEN57470.1 MFS transporter, PPP family, 3-phenylpropionic acid transporter [Mesobacillus persicus]